MRLLWQELRSRLRYKIILPFLLLTLCVALTGSAIAFSLVAGSWQERFDNQLAAVTRTVNDNLVSQERANLQFLREVVFAPPNERTGAPGVPEAVAAGDRAELQAALDPYFRAGLQRTSVRLDRLIAFDRDGRTIVDLERSPDSGQPYSVRPTLDFGQTWFVPQVLAATADDLGDKFAGILLLPDTQSYYFCTIAPVYQGETVVGGMIVAMQVDTLLNKLIERSQAAMLTVYDSEGVALVSTNRPVEGVAALNVEASVLERIKTSNDPLAQAIFSVDTIDERTFQFAFTPLRIRSATLGLLSVALSRDYIVGAWADARAPLTALTALLMLMIIGLGIYIARLITAPLEELVITARAVTSGKLDRRSTVKAGDEIGVLATSFNSMTEHLLLLYNTVRAESSQRAAIVESIVDGIVVCDEQGEVTLINRAMRRFLDLSDDAPPPSRLSDIPLVQLTEGVPGFDSRRSEDFYTLGNYIMRVSIVPVIANDGVRLGYVCMLQDMTAEVAVDRAKTNFIATISHELRTPLTVLRGNAELLLRGLAGPLEDEQRTLIDTMRQYTSNMTGLINNVIVIAGLDSGSLATDLEPLDLQHTIEEALWPLRNPIKTKGLNLTIAIGEDMPQVLADMDQLRTIVHHLVDNARRYTAEGGITISATREPEFVRIDVIDTGRGIPADLHEQVFQRFVRGDGVSEGINSSERGIGLGLAIVKQLVERQGGRIWLISAPGQGSTFSFTLRYANATGNPEKQDTPFAAAA